MKITVVPTIDFLDEEFKPPTTYYILTAIGEYVFIHTYKRDEAQKWVDNEYGAGKYTVRAAKISKGKGDVTVRGSNTRKCFTKKS